MVTFFAEEADRRQYTEGNILILVQNALAILEISVAVREK